MEIKLSIKALRDLQKRLGGEEAGFYITIYGRSEKTNEVISVNSDIAYAQKSQANWSYRLVKGSISL